MPGSRRTMKDCLAGKRRRAEAQQGRVARRPAAPRRRVRVRPCARDSRTCKPSPPRACCLACSPSMARRALPRPSAFALFGVRRALAGAGKVTLGARASARCRRRWRCGRSCCAAGRPVRRAMRRPHRAAAPLAVAGAGARRGARARAGAGAAAAHSRSRLRRGRRERTMTASFRAVQWNRHEARL